MALTEKEKKRLIELELKAMDWELKLHQARLMCSMLRRVIRISREPKTRWPGVVEHRPFERLDEIIEYTDTLTRQVKELRGS